MEPPWASRSINGKNLQKSLSSDPRGWWPWNLVYGIGYSSTTKVIQIMTLGWPWPFLWHGQICFLMSKLKQQIQVILVMYFQACSYSAYPMHSSEQYRPFGPLDDFVIKPQNQPRSLDRRMFEVVLLLLFLLLLFWGCSVISDHWPRHTGDKPCKMIIILYQILFLAHAKVSL